MIPTLTYINRQILKRKSNILYYFNENFKKMANHPSSYF
ncbi:ORF-A (plasmid) [Borreliella afzelii ACA-1]|uniref:Uncharacterized protein n=1 Tax=Borreliella spielmanii A14S TaxID=498742 RepID=C0RBZ2_9SPIR|nr:ORF-A [Borreliella afzelii ACA-1]ACN53270.1 hypothetical protein BSPA14S_D0013 [Borreliella spielmanii A14S]AJY72932.1 hypothetical protein BAFK78_D020 [Borreliella afzelii K78]